MRTRPCLLILMICLVANHLSAQNLARFVVGSAGLSTKKNDMQLSFTVGEPASGTFHPEGPYISQGFQQAYIEDITTGAVLPAFVDEINTYPNPTENLVTLEVQTSKPFEFSIALYSAAGKELRLPAITGKTFGGKKYRVDLSGLDKGLYHLMIKTKKGIPVKIVRIIKI